MHPISQAQRIEQLCDFIDSEPMRKLVAENVPVSVPASPGSLGFDVPLWLGLGVVGLWASLDAYAERKPLRLGRSRCQKCDRPGCIVPPYTVHCTSARDLQLLEELDDLRHLYAHNYAGVADSAYFAFKRHRLQQSVPATLASSAHFDGSSVTLATDHVRKYALATQRVLEHALRS